MTMIVIVKIIILMVIIIVGVNLAWSSPALEMLKEAMGSYHLS